jgi:hypothetical protein
MAIVQALLAALARSAGRILNTAFGWATMMIFGKVPQNRQVYLSVIAFGSVLWILVVVGIAFPKAGTFLLSFVPLPEWVSRGVVRLVMLAAAIVLPPIVGGVSLLLKDPEDRPQGAAAKAKTILKGYPFTLGLSVTLIMMTAFAPILKVRTLARRWTGQHVPMLVEAQDYLAVVDELQAALKDGGWETERQPASWLLRAPTRVLTALSGGSMENLVAEQLTTLRAPRLEAMLHPSDLVIQGVETEVVHARALLAERLAFSRAHLTWTKEGIALEDKMRAVWRDAQAGENLAGAQGRLQAIEEELERVEVPYEEWEVLFRAKLLIERAIARGRFPEPEVSWTARTLVPLALATARVTLESPRVRAKLDDLVVGLLDRLARRTRGPERTPRHFEREAA